MAHQDERGGDLTVLRAAKPNVQGLRVTNRTRRERRPKVECPHCGSWDSRVTGCEPHARGFVRFRKCAGCGKGYSSTERVNPADPVAGRGSIQRSPRSQ
jgi:hypothetical protein